VTPPEKTRRGHGRATWLVAGLLAIAVWPASVCAQEWHDLYGDGVRALRNGQGPRAVELLKHAIEKRPRPGVNVPTYGTNFEPRYFPYLRLAEAYLLIEAPEDARRTLETSARLGLEPAAERAALESRVHTALEGKRPPLAPAPAPAAIAVATPPSTPAPAVTPPVPVVQSPVSARPEPPPSPSATPPGSTAQLREVAAAARPTPPAQRSTLDITSRPPAAQVFLDDTPVGRTDPETGRLRVTGLPTGHHRIRLAAEEHEDLIREVDLVGPSLAIDAVLSSRPVTPAPPPGAAPATTREDNRYGRPVAIGVGLLLLAALIGIWLKGFSGRPSPPREAARSSPMAGAGGGTDENLPMRFGEYQLIRRIGKGGMACVYEAERGGERFALKRPLSGFLDDPRFLERFVREAELGRTLHHPNIIRIFERGQVGETPFFAMELVEGETLRARLDLEGRLEPPRAARTAAQVAEALDYAHNKGVIHRDLKPSNIMIERSGGLKVMDYGIARAERLEGLTTSGAFLGTPNYTAPETIEATSQPKSDLYSLGVVLFEMLTGSLPFRGDTPFAVLRNHCLTPPPVPSSLNFTVPKDLDRIVLRLLSKDPSDRPTAEELLNELANYRGQAR
jgi:eukaryotic-like serine/threonine-protein kinase